MNFLFVLRRWQTIAALVLTASAVAVAACSSTVGSAGVRPLAKHHTSASLPSSFTFNNVVETPNGTNSTVIRGINDAQEIVGTYSWQISSTSITQSFTSVPLKGQYLTFVGVNYPQPYNNKTTFNKTSTGLMAINPGATPTPVVEVGWAIDVGKFLYTSGMVNNNGLLTALHTHNESMTSCTVMQLFGVNDSYDAVGEYEKPGSASSCPSHAFEVKPGEQFTDLNLSSQFSSAVATGIDNAHGETSALQEDIVGWGVPTTANPPTLGWFRSGSTGNCSPCEIKIPGNPGAATQAFAISGDGGVVAGTYHTSGGATYGFLCDAPCDSNSSFKTGISACARTDEDCNTYIYGINDADDICGYYTEGSTEYGFVGIPIGSSGRRAARRHNLHALQGPSAGSDL